MTNLSRISTPAVPTKLPLRARLIVRYVRWRGPVASARTGVTLVRHRRSLRTGVRTARIAIPAITVAAAAGAVYRRRQQATIPAGI